jgi:hypothetical protein
MKKSELDQLTEEEFVVHPYSQAICALKYAMDETINPADQAIKKHLMLKFEEAFEHLTVEDKRLMWQRYVEERGPVVPVENANTTRLASLLDELVQLVKTLDGDKT